MFDALSTFKLWLDALDGGTVQVSRLGVDKLKRTSTVLVSPHSCELVVIRALLASRRRSCMGCKQPPIKKRIKIKIKNHGTQDSRVVPHRGTNWAALRLTAQIERDAVLSKSYGRG